MSRRFTDEMLRDVPGYRPPEERICVGCGDQLKQNVLMADILRGDYTPTRVVYGCDREQLFCTLRCAHRYAVWMYHKHGTRTRKGD
jgi:hypothetical protein